jgi:uncharacterized protein YbjT (DUF2867 family)
MREAGCGHLVYVSIVGVDRIPLAYYQAKLDVERRIEGQQAVPWTIQRATQFHPFVAAALTKLMRLPVLPLPSALRFQPVDRRRRGPTRRARPHGANGPGNRLRWP